MCGRYAYILPPEAMIELFKTLNELLYPPRYNIAPTQPVVMVRGEADGRYARLARWGLVPPGTEDPKKGPPLINARAESMWVKPAFKEALKYQRCIVPASGYYEWKKTGEKTKQPYYITLADGQPMAFAGLYSTWEGPNGEMIDSVATVTTTPNKDLEPIHDRMPVILRGQAIEDWLDTKRVRGWDARQLALPLPEGVVKFHPVSTRVGSSEPDDPDLIKEVTPEKPQPPAAKPKKAAAGQLDLF